MSEPRVLSDLWATDAVARLFADSGIAFIIVTPDMRIVDVNSTFADRLGYSREALLGMTTDQITAPEDKTMTHRLFQAAKLHNMVMTFEKRYLTHEGKPVWYRGRSEPLRNEAGEIEYRIVMLEDITAEKNNAFFLEQLAAIVDKSNDAIFRTDLNGIIEFWNSGAEQLFGYTESEVLGRHASLLAANPYTEEELKLFERMRSGEVVRQQSAQSRHKNGTVIDVSVLIFPVRTPQGEISGYAAVQRDMRDLRRLSEQLRLSQRMKTAGILAGGIAHDFNNILTVIRGACDVLQDEFPRLQGSSHLALIERSTEKAASLTQQLLAFSRRQRITPVVLDPNALLEKLQPIMQRTLGEDIALSVLLRSHWRIKEDPTQLEQIILNISVNARQAMPQGGMLEIATENCTLLSGVLPARTGWHSYQPDTLKPGDYVRVTVSDNGVGMARDVLERIFEPFFTTKTMGGGTGLGLAVVYGMVTQVGGGIRVLTCEGQGTRFQIYLPRVEEELAERREPLPPIESAAPRGRILVVDDDANVRSLLVRVLKVAGYDVGEAGSAEEALARWQDIRFDLVVSDVVMPGLSGPEFAQVWLGQQPATPFLFISGYVEKPSQIGILSLSNFLAKPFKPAVFLEKVAAVLRAPSTSAATP